jgi:hypothetical protein
MQLIAPQFLGVALVGRATEKGSKIPHRANISSLRVSGETADRHILDHALA